MKKRHLIILMIVSFAIILMCCGIKKEEQRENEEKAQEAQQELASAEEASSEMAEAEDTEEEDELKNLPLRVIDDKYRTTYEIFVYSFADSNGDGVGDLKGVLQNLDYVNDGDDTTFEDLGCNSIWLMPVSPSPSYHKYDVTDYKAIDPEYGTMEDFDALVAACHERGIDLYIDTVINHTSSEHPWFKAAADFLKQNSDPEEITTDQESADEEKTAEDGSDTEESNNASVTFTEEALESCPYLAYYNFSTMPLTGYERLNGTNWYYEARFWSGMPDLNLDNEKVREEIADITKFWTEHGVDGFRLDAVAYYYTDQNDKNIEFMTWLNDTIKSQNPDAYIVGEAWISESAYAQYYQSGIDSFFDFNYANGEGMIAKLARGKLSAGKFAESLKNTEQLLYSYNPDYIDAPFYTNHDMARSAGYFTGKGADNSVKLAGGLNLLMGGNAFIYYGEELGMRGSGKDENKRAPMYWVNEVGQGEEYDRLSSIMCDGPKGMEDAPMLNSPYYLQNQDEYSILSYFRNAVRMRNSFPVIARGTTEPVEAIEQDRLGAFIRSMKAGSVDESTFGPSSVLVLFNNSDEAITVDLSKNSDSKAYTNIAYQLNVSSEKAVLEGTNVTVPAYGILLLNK